MIDELEMILKEYFRGELAERITNRRLELAYPPRQNDEQTIKTSNSSPGSPTERFVLELIMDRELERLERRRKCIKKFLDQLDEVDKKILIYRYKCQFTWVKIAQLTHCSKRTCTRKRRVLLDDLAIFLAWEL